MESFADVLFRGGSPSLQQFLERKALPPVAQPGPPISELMTQQAMTQPQAQPGQAAQAPAQSPVQAALQKFLGNPMLLNVLAQQGHSLTPGPSPLGVIGRAGLATNQQNMASERADLTNEILRQQANLTRKKSEAGSGGERIVQSAQTLSNGNIGFLNAFTGEVVDTGQKASGKGQVIDMPGLGQVIYDGVTNTFTQVNPEDVIQTARSDRSAADTEGENRANRENLVPAALEKRRAEALANGDANIEANDEFMGKAAKMKAWLENGQLSTGYLRGMAPAVTTEEQLFEVFAGGQILDRISSVTLGALSKGEMDFLQSTVVSRRKTPEANIAIIDETLRILRAANERVRTNQGAGGDTTSDAQSRIDSL